MKHVYDWIEEPATSEEEGKVKAWLDKFTLSAVDRMPFQKWLDSQRVTCDYEGERYRMIGASRFGDVWLTKDMNRLNGYDLRVDVEKCSDWKVENV